MSRTLALFFSIIHDLFNEKELIKFLCNFYVYNHSYDHNGKTIYVENTNINSIEQGIIVKQVHHFIENTIYIKICLNNSFSYYCKLSMYESEQQEVQGCGYVHSQSNLQSSSIQTVKFYICK